MDVWNQARGVVRAKNKWRRQVSFGRRATQETDAEEALLGVARSFKSLRSVKSSDGRIASEQPWWRSDAHALRGFLVNWINLLLVAVPLGILAGALKWSPVYVFCLNFLALIPLALLLGDVTEDLALRYGSVIGGLINATFGNIVEIILSIAALFHELYGVVAASLLGSILSNLLLVTGCSFFFGGLFNKTQKFNAAGTRASSSLLFLAALAFLIPTGASLTFGADGEEERTRMVLGISRGTAVVLLLCYACYLGFQLGTHVDLFQDQEGGVQERAQNPSRSAADVGSGGSAGAPARSPPHAEAAEEPVLSLFTSIAALTAITAAVAVASEFLTASLESFSKRSGLGEAFLGTIVLPIAGNACEHMTAVIVATKNKMDLSMGVAIGSSIQVALFAVPLAVVVGWVSGHPFSLNFDPFSAVALMLSVAQVNFVTAGATSHWLLGVQLIALFLLLSLAYYFK